MILPFLLTLAAASSWVAINAQTPPVRGGQVPARQSPSHDPLSVELDGHLKDGASAIRRGDYGEAERQYREVARMLPHAPLGYGLLAHLYDRAGRRKDAYAAYRTALAEGYAFPSSMREAPGPLAHFGDLALEYGTVAEARKAYAMAAAVSTQDDVWDPRPVPLDASLPALQAAAHTAAAIVDLWGGAWGDGKAAALRELDAAKGADPQYWVAYYYRAFLGHDVESPSDAIRDAATAERLAPPKGRRQVRWMRAGRRIPDPSGNYLSIPPPATQGSRTSPPDIP